jgi:hypothetical protein
MVARQLLGSCARLRIGRNCDGCATVAPPSATVVGVYFLITTTGAPEVVAKYCAAARRAWSIFTV